MKLHVGCVVVIAFPIPEDGSDVVMEDNPPDDMAKEKKKGMMGR